MNQSRTKKLMALLLAIVAIALTFASCGKNGGTSKVPKEFRGKLMEPYMQLIVSNKYTYETTPQDTKEGERPVFYAKNTDSNVMLTFQIVSGSQSTPCSIYYTSKEDNDPQNGNYYYVFSSEGIYTAVPNNTSARNEVAAQLEKLSIDYLMDDSFVESGKVSYKGKTYQYEDYSNAKRGVRNRFLFDEDGNLKLMGKVQSNGKVSNLATISIYETNPSVFDDVYNYRAVDYYTLFPADQKKAASASVQK